MIAPEVLLSDMINRQVPEGSFLDWPGPIPYAHQGGPEADQGLGNTMPVIRRAIEEYGYRYIETDLRATAAGELVLAHEPILPDGRRVADLNVEERIGLELVLADELLEEFPDTRFSLDAKRDEDRDPAEDDPSVGLTLEVIRNHNAFGRVCLASFSSQSIQRMRADSPPGTVSALSWEEGFALLDDIENPGAWPGPYPAQIASAPPEVITPERIAAAHARGVEVHIWTINDARQMRELLDAGADGIYTDYPDILKQVLIERNQWHT